MTEKQIITTLDEEGKEVNLQLIDMVNYDGQDYALLIPENADENNEESEVVLMRLKTEHDKYLFEVIDDDDEFDLVSQAILDDQEASEKNKN